MIWLLKCDQESIVKKDTIDKVCDDLGFLGFFETSAKENFGVDESVKFLLTQVISWIAWLSIVFIRKSYPVISSLRMQQGILVKNKGFL